MLAGLTLTAPFMLAALATLPVLWWLLRLTPPAPKRVDFPAVRILNRLPRREETPSRSPWWLTVLRLLLAAAIIIALAGPRLQQSPPLSLPDGPMALIIDNGWSSAPHWTAQMTTAQTLLGEAGDADRLVLLVPTAGLPSARLPVPAEEAAETLETLTPRPYPGRYSQAADAVEAAAAQAGGAFNVVLLSDGIANDPDSLTRLLALDANGEARIFGPQGQNQALALRPPVNGATDLRVGVVRPGASASIGAGEVRALDSRGRAIAETEFSFGTGETEAEAVFALPVELRNSIRRLEITGSRSAASVQLLDRSAQRRTVALVSGEAGDADQPLLSTDHYVINALS
ncbi:MAG: BatA domain-containing protein, partial [Pseudomonadota bacterium]